MEANIIFKNGLTIPLLTEYLKTDGSLLNTPEGKQECELVTFERFSRNKHKRFAELLHTKRKKAKTIPDQPHYRERYQQFYWYNDVMCGDGLTLKKYLVSCLEKWKEVDKRTGEIIAKHSQH